MLKKIMSGVLLRWIVLAIYLGCGAHYALAESSAAPKSAKEAMKISQDTKQYLFLLFYDKKDSA